MLSKISQRCRDKKNQLEEEERRRAFKTRGRDEAIV